MRAFFILSSTFLSPTADRRPPIPKSPRTTDPTSQAPTSMAPSKGLGLFPMHDEGALKLVAKTFNESIPVLEHGAS